MEKFQNKYRIPSARLQSWDYRWAGAYFITICTAGREHYFGEIESGKLEMSHIAIVADILWHEIPHHSNNTELGAFVVMPNHIHGILIIAGNGGENINENGIDDGIDDETGDGIDDETGNVVDRACPVSTTNTIATTHRTTQNHWTTTISKYWKKFGIVNYWFL